MKKVIFINLAILLLVSCTCYTYDQIKGEDRWLTGEISGKVVDENNLPLESATVEIKQTNWKATTDSFGMYLMKGVKAGNYNVIAKYKDRQVLKKNIKVRLGYSINNVNFKLKPETKKENRFSK